LRKNNFMPASTSPTGSASSIDSLKALLQHKTRVQRTLSESLAAFSAASDWNALNESLLKECVKALNAQAAFVIAPREKELVVVAADDLVHALFQDTEYAALKDAASIAIQRHKNLLFAEGLEKGAGRRSMVCVPVFDAQGKPLAVIGVFGKVGGGAFTEADVEVLSAIALSASAAIEKISLKTSIALKEKEIEFINRINRYTTSIRDLRELLEAVLSEMTKALGAEMGVVLLKESETAKKFEVAGATDVAKKEFEFTHYELPKTLALEAAKSLETKRLDKVGGVVSNALLQPIALDGVVVGVFEVFNKTSGGGRFTLEDASLFSSLVKQANNAVFQEQEKKKIKELFTTYVSKEFGEKIIESALEAGGEASVAPTKGERKILTVLFTDLRGFTAISESLDAREVLELLNEYLDVMTQVVFKNHGQISDIIGDAIFAIFGATPQSERNHELLAVKTAFEMNEKLKELNEKWKREDKKVEFKMGAGINTGEMILGNIGSKQFKKFGVVGDNVNTGSRIAGVAQAGQVIINDSTFKAVRSHVIVKALEPVFVKNKKKPLQLYEVLELR